MRQLVKLTLATLGLAATITVSAQDVGNPQLTPVNAALQVGEADKALSLLDAMGQYGNRADAKNLRCRVEYSLEHWDRAANNCEQAVKLDGQNSDYHLWLGRALGEKASRASFMSAYSEGKRVREEFEEAVRLNPRNVDALADLGEFYYTAPGVVGGGLSKAEAIAAQLEKIDAARGHEMRGHIAEERKDFGTAEREYKQAISAAAHPAFQWMELAGFYRHHERWTEMESAVRSGQNAAERDKRVAAALYDGAGLLIKTNRDLTEAAQMLEAYLASSAKTEKAPAFAAHTQLARVKQQLGDTSAASRERAAALALAHDYKPAQDLKH